MKVMGFPLRRRTFLGLPITSLFVYAVSGLLGLSARADGNRVWRINATNYTSGIRSFFDLLQDSAKAGGSLPVASVMWYFPLNPTTPDAFQRLAKRSDVAFASGIAVAEGKYDSLDFKDDAIGAVSVILPTRLSAKYVTSAEEIRFDFEGNDDQLAQVVIWNIPQDLFMPKSLRVKALSFKADGTRIVLSNSVNTGLLEMQLFTGHSALARVTLASTDKLSTAEAVMLLAANTSVCCNGICTDGNGGVGSDDQVNTTYSIVRRVVPPTSGTCSILEVKPSNPPPMNEYAVVAGGFRSMEAASQAMNTKYKDVCTPPKK
ncbi:hypothetical protein [Burkholderia sp. BCC1972]|uniref:hypothetical protein n=1 Tax=Burkholderia sp. BCC1972 TaxID=2817438 RepID=UPI002ABE9813|nr:hypothetical protein [Burkholderia sp. BCC1972]